jgi:formylglycine-generating enzyme required for sulfatase activity
MWEAVCGAEKEWDGAPVANPNEPKLVAYYRSAFQLIERLNALGVAPRGFKFRLPSGSEATYARRAGTSTDYPFGNDPKKAREFGNVWAETKRWSDGYVFDPDVDDPTYWEDGFLALAPVRSFKPNAWGLYDTFGNAGELCGVEFWGDYWPIVERYLGSVMRNERQNVELGPLQVLDLTDEPSSSPLARIRIFEPEGAKGGNANVAATDLRETGGVPARKSPVLPEISSNSNRFGESGFRLVLALDAGEREETPGERWKPGAAPGERRTFEIDGVEFAFRYCPPRTFETDDALRSTLGAERGFWLLETETTVEAFRAFVEATGFQIDKPSWRRGDDTTLSWKNPGFEIKDDYPATCVAPEAADAFCAWAREKTGLAIRLPSVGEYAVARTADAPSVEAADAALRRSKTFENVADAALERAFGYAKPISRVDDGFARLAPVRSFKPNAWGLYDLRGNVAEITADWRYGTWNDEKFAWLLANGGPVAGRELVGERWSTNKPTVREPDVCGPRVLKNDVGFRILVECE